MKKFLLFVTALLLTSSGITPALAVENGVDESGNPFVVPISSTLSATKATFCSGTLIAPSVAVTAGHCVLDDNGLVNREVFVGKAGSSFDSISSGDLVSSIEITSTYRTGGDGKIGDDDLAFLVLSKPQTMFAPIRLASESEVTSYKASGTPLKAIGYGYYSDAGTEKTTFPKSFTGTFSNLQPSFANSAFMKSTSTSNSCAGDSGAPILVSTPSTVILVGILTGGSRSVNCSKKYSDGAYYSMFTLISRYSNLAFASALTSITKLQDQLKSAESKNSDLTDQVSTLTDESISAKNDLVDAQDQLTTLKAQVASLQAKLPSTIVCAKGKLTQKITAIKPKCPNGYKVKA